MDHSRLVTLRFIGGPLDGHELIGQRPLEPSIGADGGRYLLAGYTVSGVPGEPAKTAAYRWQPDP
ncbi:MAG TPA: hypothetical protein VGL44_09610 [Gaiellales bacterium]|jgi:hypothetical protein